MLKYSLFALLLLLTSLNAQATSIYQQNNAKANEIIKQMTIDEKIGQLILPSYDILANSGSKEGKLCKKAFKKNKKIDRRIIKLCGIDQIKKYHLGSVLQGGAPYFTAPPTLANWLKLNELAAQQHREGSPNDPLLLTGNDTVHGNQHLAGAVIFPHNINLGMSHDLALVKEIGRVVAEDSLASGFNWAYMPTVAVAQDLRWGRTYESFGLESDLIRNMAKAYVSGFQDIQASKLRGVLATAKHFIGDGGTLYGLDEGDDQFHGSLSAFWKQHGPGYEGALEADVGSIMASFSAINGDNTRMHFGGRWDIINLFKHQGISSNTKNYRLDGFVVSDWNGPTRAGYFYEKQNHCCLSLSEKLAKSINAGIDMIMLGPKDTINPLDPNSPPLFTEVGEVVAAVKQAYNKGLISEARLQEALNRILTVKLAMAPQLPANYQKLQAIERKLALRAAQESLVLLKNTDHVIPLQRNQIKNVIFLGDVDDVGLQNGGWTINWQGQKGNKYFLGANKRTSGTITLEQGIKNALKHYHIKYYHADKKSLPSHLSAENTIVIALLAEVPYAEFMGDIGNPWQKDPWFIMGAKEKYNKYLTLPQSKIPALTFTKKETSALRRLAAKQIPIITILYSGRPMLITTGKMPALTHSNAVIAAFLPGTLGGQAIANILFGDYRARSKANGNSNTLTFPWPRDINDINNHYNKGSLFPIGYGLGT